MWPVLADTSDAKAIPSVLVRTRTQPRPNKVIHLCIRPVSLGLVRGPFLVGGAPFVKEIGLLVFDVAATNPTALEALIAAQGT